MKKLFIFGLLLSLSVAVNAQGLKYGFTVGANVNAARGSEPTKVTLGYTVGATALYDFDATNSSWYLGGSLLLSQKGYMRDNVFVPKADGTGDDRLTNRYNFNSLQLPIVVGKNFSLGSESKLFVEAGPYVSYALWGTTTAKLAGKTTTSSKIFGKDGFKRFDYGLTLGVGVSLANCIRVKCAYEYGIPNLIKNYTQINGMKSALSYKNSTISATVSYIF
ncbi:porin family protein [Prevotella sp.]|uniref:porin family protein n=1 Tax=Prevotella sp. TaxID=59823 RepID=UPI002F91C6A8